MGPRVVPGTREQRRDRRHNRLGAVSVDGDSRRVIAPVLESPQAREEQVENLSAGTRDLVVVVAEDAAHFVFCDGCWRDVDLFHLSRLVEGREVGRGVRKGEKEPREATMGQIGR